MKKFKIGVFGAGRGVAVAKGFLLLNCEVTAVCDFRKEKLEEAKEQLGSSIATYENFDEFIEHDMDAVILANYCHEHAPYAIKCFERGIHVYSECISNGTMAEGVELIRAAEKSNSIYMLAENYPHMIFNREIKRICDTKTLGKILYAEGEYNHPLNARDVNDLKICNYFPKHWRHYTPSTYYITHSLAPIMYATGATPKKVTCFAVFAPREGDDIPTTHHTGDRAAIMMTQNDDGSVFRFTGCSMYGGHHNSYRVCGTEGQVENLRGMGSTIMLRYNPWSTPEGAKEAEEYLPSWNDKDEDLINQSGHGGGDYLAARMFVECLREGKQPEAPFDLHSAVTMSSVAILAHRSMLEGGIPYDIPDFGLEECRKQYENDRKTPFYGTDGSEPNIPCCSHPDFKPTEIQVQNYNKLVLEQQ